MDIERYRGVIPAFYACYDEQGRYISQKHCQHMLNTQSQGFRQGHSAVQAIHILFRHIKTPYYDTAHRRAACPTQRKRRIKADGVLYKA